MAENVLSGNNAFEQARGVALGNLGVPLLLLTLLGMMTLPIHPLLLDSFFSFNIALSIVVLLVTVYALRPLEFAVFPTILLVATLLRLALNVASTRIVLLEGHKGSGAAGKVIQSFGEVVIGGNYAVGLVVFLILMIINFVVVTKGAGRISEVSARFTLDAMPGKQMAIDADLNAGIVTQEEAMHRREEIGREADFYGAMDGASKFVRGDAVAGILILFINIIGGLCIGVLQHDLSFSRAMEIYSLLTIGDGLVAQIPSLLLSTSAAIMVTRVNSENDMRQQVFSQMFNSPKALTVAAIILLVMGIIPGMPHFAFMSLAGACGAAAWMIQRKLVESAREEKLQAARDALLSPEEDMDDSTELGWDDVVPVDMIGLEVGYRLIPMVDQKQTGELLGRIKGIRKKLSQDLGFLIPAVHIRDNLELQPNAYQIQLMGVTAGEAEVYADKHMAINPGQVFGQLDGISVKDPAFGLDAVWIDSSAKEHAQTLGYTVVDASTVVATHLNQLLQRHAQDLLGHEELQHMLDRLAKSSPKLVENLVPECLSMSQLLGVLRSLLAEQVPIRDFRSIAEAIAGCNAANPSQDLLVASVRLALSRSIVHNLFGGQKELPVATLTPSMEQLLIKSLASSKDRELTLEPSLAEKLQTSLTELAQTQEIKGQIAALLVAAPLRPTLARFARYTPHEIHVLAYNEIPEDRQVTIEATVG